MTEKTSDEQVYPVRSLHDFLYELNKEWSKFRNGAILSIGASGIILISYFLRFLREIRMGALSLIDLLFIFSVIVFL